MKILLVSGYTDRPCPASEVPNVERNARSDRPMSWDAHTGTNGRVSMVQPHQEYNPR